jgi:hypothetical protein
MYLLPDRFSAISHASFTPTDLITGRLSLLHTVVQTGRNLGANVLIPVGNHGVIKYQVK